MTTAEIQRQFDGTVKGVLAEYGVTGFRAEQAWRLCNTIAVGMLLQRGGLAVDLPALARSIAEFVLTGWFETGSAQRK